jgi:DNA-binding transcriptional MerR regulator
MRARTGPRSDARYTIAAVSKLTGVSCHTLRIWERRHGFPVPHRSPAGHRRYDADQVEVLRRVARETRSGRHAGDIIAELRGQPALPEPAGLDVEPLLRALLAADLDEAERAYEALAGALPPIQRVSRVIEPLLIEIGERWFRGDCQIYQERCASGFLRRKLTLMLDRAQTANPAPTDRALVGTLEGERHEGGTLILGLLLELVGWRAIPLGVDLPAAEYQKAIDYWRPSAVCVSFVMSRHVNRRFAELGGLRGAPVFVGGRSIVNYRNLARRHGLIALAGAATSVVDRLIQEARLWADRQAAPPVRA